MKRTALTTGLAGLALACAPAALADPGQVATGSTATVQALSSGPQTASNSTGTVQVGQPSTPGVSAAAPVGASTGGTSVAATPTAAVQPTKPSGGPSQTASNSTGTVQVGQPATPAVHAAAPVRVHSGSITAQTRPALHIQGTRGGGRPQSSSGSTGTVQAFSGGPQTANGSTGTVQIGQPATPGVGFEAPTSLSGPMTAQTAPLLTVSLLSGSTGPQTATGSTGTVQVFAGGPQTATGSTGTVQAGQPATPGVTAGTPRGPGGSVTAIDPSGGSQTATGSTGTIQLFPGGSPATAGGGPTSTEGTAPVPTRGLAATAGVLGASPATPSAAATTRRSGTLGRRTPLTATPQARTPVGLTALPARVRGTLPFTGEALGGALLLGLMLLALGVALARREPEGAAS